MTTNEDADVDIGTTATEPQGPFLTGAFFCQTILREADGQNSAIRIIDKTIATVIPPEGLGLTPGDRNSIVVPVQLKMLVMLRGAQLDTEYVIGLSIVRPDGTTVAETMETRAKADGEARGINVDVDLNVGFTMDGTYWFVVTLDGRELTRVPHVVETVIDAPGSSPPIGSKPMALRLLADESQAAAESQTKPESTPGP